MLLRRRIVSKTIKRFQRRQAARLHKLHLDVTVLAIAHRVLRRVIEHILVAQLDADLGGDIGQLIDVLHVVTASSRQLSHFTEETRAGQLLGSSAAGPDRFKDSDSVYLYIGFPNRILYLAFGVAAVVIASIGNDQDGFAGIA